MWRQYDGDTYFELQTLYIYNQIGIIGLGTFYLLTLIPVSYTHLDVYKRQQYGKAAIVHPTGTGKSYIAFKLIEDNPEKVVIWLSPSEYIFKTQLELSLIHI